ncbi:MAG: HEXXH motif domain-containing protein [Pseudonocardiaceae bacterium]
MTSQTPMHRLPSRIFTALARGAGGPEGVRWLASAWNSRNRLLLHMLADTADASDPTTAAIVREAYRTLGALEQRSPQAVDFVVNYPAVSAWLLRTATHVHQGRISAAQPARLATVAASAAVRAAVTETVDIPAQSRVDGIVRLPSLGTVRLPPGAVRLSTSPEVVILSAGDKHIEVPRVSPQDGPGWSVLRRLSAEHEGLRLDLLVDGWEPGRMGGTVVVGRHELDRREIARWRAALSTGWRLLVSYHRAVADEVAAIHRMLVPLATSATNRASSTPSDAFGCVAMSAPTDPRTTALVLAHEVQHAKLSVLAELFPLVHNTVGQTFYAPWRRDPRPPLALLHGIYAHLAVTAFWRTQRHVEHDASETPFGDTEFVRWRTGTREAALVLLESGLLTPIGTQFVTGILDVLEGWGSDTVSRAARTAARHQAQRHRDRWDQTSGRV